MEKSKMAFVFALGMLLAAAFFTCMGEADAEPLHHEVQVVTGGRVDAQAFADSVRTRIATFVGGSITVYVIVNPHPGATTVKVTVVAPRLNARNEGRVRLTIEATPRVPGVVRNGYANVRQRMTVATSTTRL